MDFIGIRKRLGLSQEEMALLLGVLVDDLRKWEQKLCVPEYSVFTLYSLVALEIKRERTIVPLIYVAIAQKYSDRDHIETLFSVIEKLTTDKLEKEYLSYVLLERNPQWKAEDFGFRLVEMKTPLLQR